MEPGIRTDFNELLTPTLLAERRLWETLGREVAAGSSYPRNGGQVLGRPSRCPGPPRHSAVPRTRPTGRRGGMRLMVRRSRGRLRTLIGVGGYLAVCVILASAAWVTVGTAAARGPAGTPANIAAAEAAATKVSGDDLLKRYI